MGQASSLPSSQAGSLRHETLRPQTERLLAYRRAGHFIRHFTDQWLNLREIDFTTPDKQLYPEHDALLQHTMLEETRLFFNEVLRKNLPVTEFLHSDWTFLNQRLAEHYGIDGVKGVAMRRVSLKPDHHRGGVLTHASVLKVSANGTTTSPVKRGAFVLDRILGIEPPPPPPGVPGVEPDIRGATTLREQLAKHRSLTTCNSCHRVIDPPGFALENYDVIGGWRENYRSLGKDFPKPPAERTGGRDVGWYGLGLCHGTHGDHAAAVHAFERVIQLEPMNWHAWYELGMAQHRAHQPDKVKSVVEHLNRYDRHRARKLILDTERSDLAHLVADLRVK